MAWSTRELAELAGTSVRAVRHYHEVGLLAEPERRPNGWKQYGVAHLVRLLRIKRLTELGVSLPRIAALGDDLDHPAEALRSLDAELAATIERLQRARTEIGAFLQHVAPTDMPVQFAAASTTKPSRRDRAMASIMSRVLGPEALHAYAAELEREDGDPTGAEFDNLSPDADEPTRQDLARRLVPVVQAVHARHRGLQDFYVDAPRGSRFALGTAGTATADLCNTAQLDVLRRLNRLLEDGGRGGASD
jgi:DNA-binding transcriptional MerR regulator